MAAPLDLDRVQAIINRPHIVDLRDDGFTLMHPPACHPRLFECVYNLATRNNLEDPGLRGQYTCSLDRDPRTMTDPVFVIGEPAADIEGVDWNALVAELRAAREVITELDKFGQLDWMLADNHATDAARAAWIQVMDAVAAYERVAQPAPQETP